MSEQSIAEILREKTQEYYSKHYASGKPANVIFLGIDEWDMLVKYCHDRCIVAYDNTIFDENIFWMGQRVCRVNALHFIGFGNEV